MDTSETYIKMWTAAGFTEAPRQDQLQEMVMPQCSIPWFLLVKRFSDYVLDTTRKDMIYHYTMGQLWLAFVMKEKYNKVWNGDVWKISS